MSRTIDITFLNTSTDPQAALEAIIQNAPFIILGILLSLAFFTLLTMSYWFTIPLVTLDDVKAIHAYKLSFLACLKNWLPFLFFGLILFTMIIIMLILGKIIRPSSYLLVQLGIIYIISKYTSFKDIFDTSA